MKFHKLICFILILITFIFPDFIYAQIDKIDCFYLYDTIHKEKIVPNIPLTIYFQHNESKYRKAIKNKNIDTIKKIVLVMDNIYDNNKKDYNYINKVEYFLYKYFFTSKYSTSESIKSARSYLFLTYKIVNESKKNSKVKLTGSYDIREQIVKRLNEYYKIKEQKSLDQNLEYWESIILNDKELMDNSDLNNLF